MPPTRPETGYGYIRGSRTPIPVCRMASSASPSSSKAGRSARPELSGVGRLLLEQRHVPVPRQCLLDELKKHDPDIYDTCWVALEAQREERRRSADRSGHLRLLPDNSIDYAVMEKTQLACVVPMSAGWSDVGSRSSIWDVHEGSEWQRAQRRRDRRGLAQLPVHGNGKLVTVLGPEDIVVVETKDAMMVAHKDKVQDVKKLVSKLDARERSETKNHCAVYRPRAGTTRWTWAVASVSSASA